MKEMLCNYWDFFVMGEDEVEKRSEMENMKGWNVFTKVILII